MFCRCSSVFHHVTLQHPLLWPRHVDPGSRTTAAGVFCPVGQPSQRRAHSVPQRRHAAAGGGAERGPWHAVGRQQRLLPLPETTYGDTGVESAWGSRGKKTEAWRLHEQFDCFGKRDGDLVQLVELWTGTLPTQVPLPGAARDFILESTFNADLSTVSIHPLVQLHAVTSECTLKIP